MNTCCLSGVKREKVDAAVVLGRRALLGALDGGREEEVLLRGALGAAVEVQRPGVELVRCALRRGEVSLAATLIDCGAPGPRVLKDIGKLPDDVLRHVAAFLPDEGPARHLAVGLRRRDPPRPRRFSSSSRRGAAASN